ncbi:hypothetical protein C1646_818789 [Rhizophagus diaphanus]|nr:hypothetical protein C1646_818789 [Rhizophagus diaphanus] [Rhizophagus sp. MUCL 43196]
MSLSFRELGKTGVKIPAIGLGCMGKYKSIDDFEPDDVRRTILRFQGENFIKNLELVHKFEEYAITPGQLCLAGLYLRVGSCFIKRIAEDTK